jgi:ectoine hydroxylase-related dioxygenase (phytanoyl-CoA dioxygenase family)
MRLTDAQINRYDEDGFLAIDRLVDDATVEVLRAAYDDILEGRVRASGDRMQGGRVRQVMVPCRAHPAFRHNAALVEAMEIAGQLFGSAAFLFDMLIYKPPGDPAEVPWHQDMSYSQMPVAPAGLQIDVPTVQFWVALDDVDVENGCMHFLPGHHKQPLLPHRVAASARHQGVRVLASERMQHDDGRLLEIVDPERELDLSRAVAAPLRAGGATMHGHGTPHHTPPNRSDRRRRAYIFNLIRDRA